jgi:hypothetical protein
VLLVDAANVVGSRPTGWWRDRPVVVVLEGRARLGAAENRVGGVEVVHAPGHGDDALVAIAAASPEPVVLVTADRALGARCRAEGARVVGPSWLLDRL